MGVMSGTALSGSFLQPRARLGFRVTMRILHVIPYFAWRYGGPVRAVYEISREMTRRGHQVSIYTTDVNKGGRIAQRDRIPMDNGVELRYFPCLSNWLADSVRLHLSEPLRHAFRETLEKFDVMHLHELRAIPTVYAWFYGRRLGIPYIIQAHGTLPSRLPGQSPAVALEKAFFDAVVGWRILSEASRIVALTEMEANQYIGMGIERSKVTVIPNGIRTPPDSVIEGAGAFREKYGIGKNEEVILFLGRIHKTKGLDLLVDAFHDLLADIPSARLLIIGPDDGYLPHLKKRMESLHVADRVLVIGPIYGDARYQAYAEADVYVLPSRYETFPLSVLEALACGTPTVVTDRCGIADLVVSRGLGYSARFERMELKETIVKALRESPTRNVICSRFRAMASEEFNWGHVSRKVEGLYRDVMRKTADSSG